MKASKKIKRRAMAKILHAGCNVLDSSRIMTLNEALGHSLPSRTFWDDTLTDKEYRLLKQRLEAIRDRVAEVREIARHLEK